jgi:hypothetical protein
MSRAVEEALQKKLALLFPDPVDADLARQLLSEYGREEYEREASRVRLAVLKLSGPSLEKVEGYVGIAKVDYRDVLALAEYPGQLRAQTWKMNPEEKKELEAKDRVQFEAWLRDGGAPGTSGEEGA